MSLSVAEVKKIAALARIQLTPEEEKRYAKTISAVLDYMKILNEVDTSGVAQTSQVTGLEDVVRADQPRDCQTVKELLAQMPETSDGELVVPGVFADAEEDL